jgi:tubulin-folding cofactor B
MEPGNIIVVTEGWVNVAISSTCSSFKSEKKFPKDLTIGGLKGKLEMITGGSHTDMQIEVFDDRSSAAGSVKVCDLDDDLALLGSYPVDSGMRLHVVDLSGEITVIVFTLCNYLFMKIEISVFTLLNL